MDTTETITHLGLCAGYGGIELGLKRVLPTLRTVAYSEIEAFACANLVAKMEAGLMDASPIWTDLKTFPWAEFRDRVDILTGGYPCQPFSSAGKRLGTEDPRHLWPYIADGIRLLRPRVCFFENVEGHVSLGLREVVGELESLGYRTTWGIFSAAEVGAPHQRKRVFILAHRNGEGLERYSGLLAGCDESRRDSSESAGSANGSNHGRDIWPSRPGEPQHAWEPPRVVADAEGSVSRIKAKRQWWESAGGRSEEVVGDAESSRRCGSGLSVRSGKSCEAPVDAAWAGESVGNASSERPCGGAPHGSGQQAEMSGAGHESMGNAENNDWRHMPKRDSALRSELASWRQTQPTLGGDTDGTSSGLDYAELCVSCDNRTDELRLLGNGVVPATAQKAFLTLINEIQKTTTTASQLG